MLPLSLLVTFLAFSVSALPAAESTEPALLELSPTDFESTIADGVWFIEHFSPYCGHCRAFAPTWRKLVEATETGEISGVSLAQVNCAVHGDLCKEHEVRGYPQMMVYKDGVFEETFEGARDYDRLLSFLSKHTHSAGNEETIIPGETESQILPSINPDGMVSELDTSNFDGTLDKAAAFVKFFAPWCGHCKKLAPIWAQLASEMRGKLTIAEVNCELHPNICRSQGVQGYPTLFFYTGGSGDGMRKTEYSGSRKFDQLLQFTTSAIAPTLLEVPVGGYPDYVHEHEVIYLFLYSEKDERAKNQLSQAAHALLGSPPILTSASESLRSYFDIPLVIPHRSPVLLAIKDGIPDSYTSIFQFPSHGTVGAATDANGELLSQWLLANRLPSSLELSQETFQKVMNAPHNPLVVIAATPPEQRDEISRSIHRLALGWRARSGLSNRRQPRDVVFTWMDAAKWGTWMKSMYGIKSGDLPAIVLVNHQSLIYWDVDSEGHKLGFEDRTLFSTIDSVLANELAAKYSENIVERFARTTNRWLISVEESVVHHPWRTASAAVGIIIVFVLAIRRFILEDVTPYERIKKPASRLD